MLNERLSISQILLIILILALPAIFVFISFFGKKITHDKIESLIKEDNRQAIISLLRKSDSDDTIFKNYNSANSISYYQNALGFAAVKCRKEIVNDFFDYGAGKMTRDYVDAAKIYVMANQSDLKCPDVARRLKEKSLEL